MDLKHRKENKVMAQYIDKAKVLAEIKRRRRDWWFGSSTEAKFKREECDDILSFIDTLEVKDNGTVWHSFDEVLPPQGSDICVYWDRDEIITTGIWEESEKPKYASKWAYTSDLLNK